ncbi:MAG: hypothetical protein NZ807_07380 [Dehalococcoidia bacterium]|nr:hypothetical protein [Dehalococcoidia bacterium]
MELAGGLFLWGVMGLLELISAICLIIILISAFQDEVWKGLLCIFSCGLYWLYYALLEFQHEKKGLILVGVLAPTFLSLLIMALTS